ncbi:methylated-DNA--[protein]-cysteine S-methyltransferase [Paenisporosarcina indica]|uniref:methylated-DNA--[protein]-cysteine S-methyltransferase n=1 Tax=Paenisporosarcina indica TaxID=650093 RepID=UPI00094FFA06|nr:methylated-DNA--[protein]-cysteine S-methyltransferase [Paenisporosarcina indica]
MIKAMESPIGKLFLQIESGKLTSIQFEEPKGFSELIEYEEAENLQLFENTVNQLNEYFEGQRISFELPLNAEGTAFQQSVWGQLPDISYGKTISYQELANRINNPKACRAVGQANRRNPLPIVIPCHRVIGKDKSLTGYAGSLLPIKEYLLQLELKYAQNIL